MKIGDKNNKKILKIVVISIAILLIIVILQFAWAKYMTIIKGKSVAEIAQWNFNVTVGTDETLSIDLAETRYPEDTDSVNRSTIAPGTSGKIILNVNADVTEVSLEYNINLDITQVPPNLIFYSDSKMKNAIYHSANNINITGFFDCNVQNKTEQKILYWSWPLETGQSLEKINENDKVDSQYIGERIILGIHVEGVQVMAYSNEPKCNVVFDANEGIITGYGNAGCMTKTMNVAENFGELPVPTRDGYNFDGWCGKNLLNFADRTIVSGVAWSSNETKREFTGNNIFIGITANNFWSSAVIVGNPQIDSATNTITVAAQSAGYGVGFDYKVKPGETYTLSCKRTDYSVNVGFYRKDGSWIKMITSNGNAILTIDDETEWIVIIIAGNVDEENKTTENIQLEKGETRTKFEPYKTILPTTNIPNEASYRVNAKWVEK